MTSVASDDLAQWNETDEYLQMKRKLFIPEDKHFSATIFVQILRIKHKWEKLQEQGAAVLHRSSKEEENSVFGCHTIEAKDLEKCYKEFSDPNVTHPTQRAKDLMVACGMVSKKGTRGPPRPDIPPPKTSGWKRAVYYSEYVYDAKTAAGNVHRHLKNGCEAFTREEIHPDTPPWKKQKFSSQQSLPSPTVSPEPSSPFHSPASFSDSWSELTLLATPPPSRSLLTPSPSSQLLSTSLPPTNFCGACFMEMCQNHPGSCSTEHHPACRRRLNFDDNTEYGI
ncbi:hypothetical protein GUITHDRAFT_132392 [Guillardia theta CCMP2712]|uniref:Uncharacterized protein n=1 Tax=Guillardia theta (strain CCMP2712) TaxID=905079 RepID=L1K013_GUITC|nr:hypothetical protein GUITHDRAFT_132392 [Guillardia theta CCMP2712]EKX53957.1 hypothetical protein GUITHDRAFT_132392 [Guillardia theta CCMP2712]|eukprot:XP_005840937.1 hypothetical protein GUITHDRAFT_132392 [Guillardia theta CCMP2712]